MDMPFQNETVQALLVAQQPAFSSMQAGVQEVLNPVPDVIMQS